MFIMGFFFLGVTAAIDSHHNLLQPTRGFMTCLNEMQPLYWLGLVDLLHAIYYYLLYID